MGVALTQVLLSLNRENTELNLRDFPEMLPNICLAGMNFHLSGVDKIARDLSELNLQGANFQKSNLEKINLQDADLLGANFRGANLKGANLKKADLHMSEKWKLAFDSKNINFQKADLSGADLQNRDLTGSNFQGTNLLDAKLQGTALSYSNLRGMDFEWWQIRKSRAMSKAEITEHDFIKHIYPRWKEGNNPEWETLTEGEQKKAMQQFCNETWIRIFDEEGKQIMPPPKKHKI